jgi:polyisoprenoid-binding protein YceI
MAFRSVFSTRLFRYNAGRAGCSRRYSGRQVNSMKRLGLLILLAVLTATPAFAQTWQIDPDHSAAQFAVRHFMLSTIRGDFSGIKGTVEYDGKDLTKAKVNATIDVATINTRVPKRDEHLKSPDFFNVAKHRTMNFVSTSITPAGAGKYKMTGNFTLLGVTKPVTFDLDAPVGPLVNPQGSRIGAMAKATIKRSDFGMTFAQPMELLGVKGLDVSDEVEILLDVELIQPPSKR